MEVILAKNYFSHDFGASDDPKCLLLIDQLQLEGYGIFWILIETLARQPDLRYPLSLVPILAKRYQTTAEKMLVVINQFGLFEIEDNEFFSLSLNRRFELMEMKSNQLRQNAIKGWQTRKKERRKLFIDNNLQENANAMQLQSKSKANAMEIKEKKTKENKIKETNKLFTDVNNYTRDNEKVFEHKLQQYVFDNFKNVSKMQIQLTPEQCENLKNEFTTDIIISTLESMENYKPLLKKNTSVYLTLKNWANRDLKRKQMELKNENSQRNRNTTYTDRVMLNLADAINSPESYFYEG